jgi:hypothetical protein
MGWGMVEVATSTVNIMAVCASLYDVRSTREVSGSILPDAYLNDCFPINHEEISALFQVWAVSALHSPSRPGMAF